MRASRYMPVHAVAAILATGYFFLVPYFQNGVSAFWRNFVYGTHMRITPEILLQSMGMTAGISAAIFVVLWGVSFLETPGARRARETALRDRPPPFGRGRAVLLAALTILPVTALALGLHCACGGLIEWIGQEKPANQELITCFTESSHSLLFRVGLGAAVLVQAPVFEEAIFRGVIFRGLCRGMSVGAAMALSGAVFALIHNNAASFVPLWFLGVFFADLYRRTGTILAPMAAHLLFNAVNLVMLFLFPEMAAG